MFEAINGMLLDMLAAVARKDYEDRRRRQAQGQEKVKAEGKYVGRPENKRRNNRIATMLRITVIANYENHYNARLNKCFYLEIATTIPQAKDRKSSKSLRLFDLHENREVATFFRFDGSPAMTCQIGLDLCQTEQEWHTLVKPFMEE